MNSKNRGQNLRKVYDTLYHIDNYIQILKNDTSIPLSNKKILINYLLNTLIHRANLLEDDDLKQYIKNLKQRKIYKYFPNNTKKDKIRRSVVRFNLSSYVLKNRNK